MKRVLILAYGFPGLGSRGVGLINRLPENGFLPTVLTNRVRGRQVEATAGLLDSRITVVEVASMNKSPFRVFSRLFGLWSKTVFFEKLFFVPDPAIIWAFFAYRKAIRLLRQHSYEAVMTISPPESAHLAGLWLKRRTGIRWVANFEDLWSSKRHVFNPPTRIHEHLLRKMEARIYNQCDGLIANTPANKEIYVRDFGVTQEKITVVTLGFDKEESIRALSLARSAEKVAFTVGYMGSFDKDGFPFQESLRIIGRLRKNHPKSNVHLELCGSFSRAGKKFVETAGFANAVRYHGVLPHERALVQIAPCDILLVLLYETAYSPAIVPHKLYHYLGLGKPILALGPESGEMFRILSETNTGAVFSLARQDAAYQWLEAKWLEKLSSGRAAHCPNEAAIGKYENGRLAQTLSSALSAKYFLAAKKNVEQDVA